MCNHSHRVLTLLLAFALWPAIGTAQGGATGAPSNSHMKRYGGGWECDRGYRQINEACAAVEVPPNAYLVDSAYGRGW